MLLWRKRRYPVDFPGSNSYIDKPTAGRGGCGSFLIVNQTVLVLSAAALDAPGC